MPIYEYECRSCRHRFETLVRSGDEPFCPQCQHRDLERLVSLFAVDSGGSRQLSLSAIRKKNARTTRDKAWADLEYDRKHRHE